LAIRVGKMGKRKVRHKVVYGCPRKGKKGRGQHEEIWGVCYWVFNKFVETRKLGRAEMTCSRKHYGSGEGRGHSKKEAGELEKIRQKKEIGKANVQAQERGPQGARWGKARTRGRPLRP